MHYIAIDFETPYSAAVSLKGDKGTPSMGYWQYTRHPETVPYLVSVHDGTEGWAGHPRDFNFASLEGAELLSHNAAFDQEVAIAAQERGSFVIPQVAGLFPITAPRPVVWHCTMNLSAYVLHVHSLADAAHYGLGAVLDKGLRDRVKGMDEAAIRAKGWWDEMLRYGISDAKHCWLLWDKYAAQWPEQERRLSQLTIDQGRRGVAIDEIALETAISLMAAEEARATASLPWVQRGEKAGSSVALAEECRKVGIARPPVKAHDPEAAEQWEEEYADRHPFVMALRCLRKARKTLATLRTIQCRLHPEVVDGVECQVANFSLKYSGTHPTRRWAGEGGWNLQNQNREPLFLIRESGFVFARAEVKPLLKEWEGRVKEGTAGAIGQLSDGTVFLDLRGLTIARPGHKLGPTDLSQIEPRILNWVAGNTEFIRLVAAGQSPYEAHARTRMGWTRGELKKENPKQYAYAKERVLSLGYSAGHEKFRTRAKMNGIDIDAGDEEAAKQLAADGQIHLRRKTEKGWEYWSAPKGAGVPLVPLCTARTFAEPCFFVTRVRENEVSFVPYPVEGANARREVMAFRAGETGITTLWNNFERELRASVGNDLTVPLPNGETLVYRQVVCDPREVVDEDTGKRRVKGFYTALVGKTRKAYYGGMIVENACQATARYVFGEGMLRMLDAGFFPLFSVHDEAVPEVRPDVTVQQLEACLSVTPAWLPGCPIAAEGKLVDRYAK